jgi:O-antigen ligase
MRVGRERLLAATGWILCAGPLLVVTWRGWSNGVLFVAALLSCAWLWGAFARPGTPDPGTRRWKIALLLALAAPLAATALGAALRGELYWPLLDAPSRFLLAMPVFLFALRARVDAASALQWILPLSLLIAGLYLAVIGSPSIWPAHRAATYFADPLVFGYLCLAFGMMCLVAIPLQWPAHASFPRLAALVLGAVLGVYLSLRSGSRTGWLAVPIVITAWLHYRLEHRVRHVWAGGLLLSCLLAVGAYLFVPAVHERINVGLEEAAQYTYDGVAPISSISLRLTFLRIAADMFVLHPWAGVGDTARAAPAALDAFRYASPEAANTAFQSAFHNQVITSAVRHGVAGGLAALALLLVPVGLFAARAKTANPVVRENALMGLAFSICIAVSSLTTEVVDLKYTASLYALMTAVLCGATLARHGQE